MSKAWKRIEELSLINRSRSGREAEIELLCEDGHGARYTRPKTAGDDRWFTVSHEYWLDGWHLKLNLPGKAMLLIALSLENGFYLPFPRAEEWYGISRNTAQRGMNELVHHNLVTTVERWEREPLSNIGHRKVVNYTLCEPFEPRLERTKKTSRRVTKGRPTRAGSRATNVPATVRTAGRAAKVRTTAGAGLTKGQK